MKTTPILFNDQMVRAILEDRKTQTRRVLIPQPAPFQAHDDPGPFWWFRSRKKGFPEGRIRESELSAVLLPVCPYGQVGDRLWVREAWRPIGTCFNGQTAVEYRAGGAKPDSNTTLAILAKPGRWRPSIHMPRQASRLTLEITEIRVERVQQIRDPDVRAEGVSVDCVYWGRCNSNRCPEHQKGPHLGTIPDFRRLWDEINGKRGYPWASNPWLWVIAFKKVVINA